MTATGALVGMLLGVGLVLVAAGVPWWRRARLDSRLAPYLDRGAAKAARAAAAAAPVTPFPTLERLLRPTLVELAANLDRRLGGRDATARRLVAAGRPADVDAFGWRRWSPVLSASSSPQVLLLAVLRGRAVPVPLAVGAAARWRPASCGATRPSTAR
jgi:tight adherence protein C